MPKDPLQEARRRAVAQLREKKLANVPSMEERMRRIDELGSPEYQGKRFVMRKQDGMTTIALKPRTR